MDLTCKKASSSSRKLDSTEEEDESIIFRFPAQDHSSITNRNLEREKVERESEDGAECILLLLLVLEENFEIGFQVLRGRKSGRVGSSISFSCFDYLCS